MATINKTSPSCARVKVQVDLLSEFPKFIELEVVNEAAQSASVESIKVQDDMLTKYCKTFKLQGPDEGNFRVPHPELGRDEYGDYKDKNVVEKNAKSNDKAKNIDEEAATEDVPMIRIRRQLKK